MAEGELLFEAGESSYDLFVVLEGEVEIVAVLGPDDDSAEHEPLFVFGPGNFVGELNLLTGQRRFLTARVSGAGRVLAIPQPDFRRLMSLRPALAGVIFGALLARRELLRTGEGAQAIRLIGSRYSPEAMGLRRSPSTRAWPTRGSTSRTPRTSRRCSRRWTCARRTCPS
jgi:thioredoxin reductase (NADPH)